MRDADGLLNEDLDFPWTLFVSIIKYLPIYSTFYFFQTIKQFIIRVAFHRQSDPVTITPNNTQVKTSLGPCYSKCGPFTNHIGVFIIHAA